MKRITLLLTTLMLMACVPALTQEVDNIIADDEGFVYVDAWDDSGLLCGESFVYVWYAVDASVAADYQDPAQLEEIARTTIPQAAFVFPPTPRMIRYVGATVEVARFNGTVDLGTIIWSFEPDSVAIEMGGTFAVGPEGGIVPTVLGGLGIQ